MKKMKLTMVCLFVLSGLLLAGCAQRESQLAYVGGQAALQAALDDAGFTENEVQDKGADMENRNGTPYYEVEFTKDGVEYHYDVDATTGRVIQSTSYGQTQQSASSDKIIQDRQQVQEEASTSPGASTNTSGSGTMLTADDAKQIALEHAGLTAEQVTFIHSTPDWDDGRQIYDVEFYTADYREYDYEIDAYSGEIYSYDQDAEDFQRPTGGSVGTEGTISADEAKAIALAQVPGATEENIWEFSTDYDDGRLEYEGKIVYSELEYDFTVDGYSGAIRDWEVESIYD